jgi:hypothetical protein
VYELEQRIVKDRRRLKGIRAELPARRRVVAELEEAERARRLEGYRHEAQRLQAEVSAAVASAGVPFRALVESYERYVAAAEELDGFSLDTEGELRTVDLEAWRDVSAQPTKALMDFPAFLLALCEASMDLWSRGVRDGGPAVPFSEMAEQLPDLRGRGRGPDLSGRALERVSLRRWFGV